MPAITREEGELYERHWQLLCQWNEQMSLVSRTSLTTALATHYLDSIWMSDFAVRFGSEPFFDLGTGAGFPGIIFGIRHPTKTIVLFEKSLKKQSFLSVALSQLQLPNIELRGLFEGSGKKGTLLGRAVIPREELFPFAAKTLAPGAFLMTSLGGNATPSNLPAGFEKVAEESYELPLGCGSRRVEMLRIVPRGTKPTASSSTKRSTKKN